MRSIAKSTVSCYMYSEVSYALVVDRYFLLEKKRNPENENLQYIL